VKRGSERMFSYLGFGFMSTRSIRVANPFSRAANAAFFAEQRVIFGHRGVITVSFAVSDGSRTSPCRKSHYHRRRNTHTSHSHQLGPRTPRHN